MGSLLAALASFLDARACGGQWLLRMEDLDPPREPEGAADTILRQLDELELHWDGPVLYQSQRHQAYQEALNFLAEEGLCFPCSCTRQRLKSLDGIYDGHCRGARNPGPQAAIRMQVDNEVYSFEDRIQGQYSQQLESDVGDFVILRKDRLFAYQLAVVVDDEYQQITDIVRGQDLLDSTPRQIYLQQKLNYATPRYAHIPVIVNSQGEKLSKQRFATPVDAAHGPRLLIQALSYLGQSPEPQLEDADCHTILGWATENWDIQAVPKLANIPETAE